jgi:AsmA-like C-terminal region
MVPVRTFRFVVIGSRHDRTNRDRPGWPRAGKSPSDDRGGIPMKSCRLRLFLSILSGIILIPPLLWVGVVLIAPTGWAKRHVVACLEARTHRQVRLERLSVRLFGGIQLVNLEIGSPQGSSDPWLKTTDLRLDIGLPQLLWGNLEPSLLEVEGVKLRVLRRADGTFELADFLGTDRPSPQSSEVNRDSAQLAVQIRNGTIELIDEPTKTKLLLKNIEGEGTREGRQTFIHHLRGTVNGGPFQLVGQLDRSAPVPSAEGRFTADDVILDDGMSELLRYVVPVLAGSPLNLKGRMHADFHLKARGASPDALRQSLAGAGEISINPIDLDGAPVVDELRKVAEISGHGRLASIHSDFVVKDRRITTDHFTLNIGRIPMTLSGWTDLNGQLEYRIKLEELTQRIPDKARRLLGELNLDVDGLTTLTLSGTIDQMVVRLNGTVLDRNLIREAGLRREDREKLKVMGRQFLDKIVR